MPPGIGEGMAVPHRRPCAMDPGGGLALGAIFKVHQSDFDYQGHRRYATPGDPEHVNGKTDQVAAHKGSVLAKI